MSSSLSRGAPDGTTLETKVVSFVRSFPEIGGQELISIVQHAFELAYERSQAPDQPNADRISGLLE